jgi:pyruvate ferredoxin oxidoreductase gamma subunit
MCRPYFATEVRGESRVTRWARRENVEAMFQVRIHGRGGQGVVTAAELLSVAAFLDGHHAQAFPSFGSERTGAPVVAFCRIDDREIRVREPIMAPDALIIQDPTLLHQVDVFGGLKHGGRVLLNSTRPAAELGLGDLDVICLPASDLAREHLGKPLPNAALLGAFAAVTAAVTLGSVAAAIRERFPTRLAEGNIHAAEAAFALAGEPSHA